MTTNDDVLTPRACEGGDAHAFDMPGLEVGAAEYDEGPTGCTVLVFRAGASAAMDVRGGAVGVTGDWGWTHGICLAGGSLMGLEATAGVAAELFARNGYKTGFVDFPLASGGIVYDFREGRSSVYPDKALGRAATRAARPGWFPLGARGAGRSAGVGQGAASGTWQDARLAVFVLVNALGAIVDREGHVVYGGNRDRWPGAPERAADERERRLGLAAPPPGTHTTLTVLVTDAHLDGRSLRQLGRQVHASMTRAIQPFHTPDDGDTLWCVSTGAGPSVPSSVLGIVASELAWDAVLAAATPRR